MNTLDTICAPATAVGGAVAVIRISGPKALETGRAVWQGRSELSKNNARKMLLGRAAGDHVLAVYMPGPNSYTGDDVVELHCHGGNLACRAVLDGLLKAGCRTAEPGEFTFRAFVNGKMDLVQAEAVSDLIGAQSDMALHLAERQLAGALSSEFSGIRDTLIEVLAECESHLDFPDESLDWDLSLAEKLAGPAVKLEKLLNSGQAGKILRDGVRVVIAGRPNAGKSSLLNLLLGYDRAIVTDIAGTTRDTLEEKTELNGIPVRLTDTAGLREGADTVEKLGIERSRASLRTAEMVFWLLDATAEDLNAEISGLTAEMPENVIALWNKIDLAPERTLPKLPCASVKISALTGENSEELIQLFSGKIWQKDDWNEPEIAVNARHQELLSQAVSALPEAIRLIGANEWELAAIPLRSAIDAIGGITGETADPDVLENIFSRFCIGK